MGKMPSFNSITAASVAVHRPCPGLLSVQAVAELLDVSEKTVRRMITAGELPVHRVGHRLRVSPDDLRLFLVRRRS
jgi:excisionase family DNA binding protein